MQNINKVLTTSAIVIIVLAVIGSMVIVSGIDYNEYKVAKQVFDAKSNSGY